MSDIYRDFILDHYRNPRNFGEISKPDFENKEKNMLCGDVVEISGKLKAGKIDDVKFAGKGCVISQASASILMEHVKGKSVKDIGKMEVNNVVKLLGVSLSSTRTKCAELSLKSLKKALKISK